METMLGALTSRTHNTSVRVRVLNAWWQAASGKDPTLELILGDEEGGRIAASIRGKSIDQWKNVMIEGATVFMRNFTVGNNDTRRPYITIKDKSPYIFKG